MPSFIQVANTSKSNKLTRKDVKNGQLFVVNSKDGKAPKGVYAHTGVRTNPPSGDAPRYQSINLKTGEEASTPNGDSAVTIVGTYKLVAQFAKDYEHMSRLVA